MWYLILIGLIIFALVVIYFLDKNIANMKIAKSTMNIGLNKLKDDLEFTNKKKDLYFYKLVEIDKLIKKNHYKNIDELKDEIKRILKSPKIN